jgi:hypothetical protein
MGFFQFFMTKRRAVVVVTLIIAGAILFWLGLSLGKKSPIAPVSGRSPLALEESKPASTYSDANSRLEELIKRQQMLGQQAADISGTQLNNTLPSAGANAGAGKFPAEEKRKKQMEALMAARNTAINGIMEAAKTGDTKKIVATMEKMDEQIRAAGLPSVIDMDKFRQMMATTVHIQDISRQLNAESQKGQQADQEKIQSLLKELSAAQAAMPKSPYNMDALEKVMKSGQ